MMKKKIGLIILTILIGLLLISCSSCTQKSSAQSSASPGNAEKLSEEALVMAKPVTISQDTQSFVVAVTSNLQKDTVVKKTIFRKEIKKVEIDSTQIFKRDSLYKQLEKTEKRLIIQQQTIDSMIVIRK
jgi:hypothetical protein